METRRESLQEVKSKASLIEAKLSDFMTLMSDEMKTMNSNLKENHTLAECLKLEQTTQEQSAKQLEDLKAVIQQQKQKEQHHEENIKVLTECLQKERKATEETLVQQNKYEMETCIQKIEKLKHKNKEQKEIIKEQANIIRSLNEIEENLTSKMKNEADDRASERESRTAAITSLKEDIKKMRKESAAMKLLYEEDKRILVESLEEERNKKEDCFKPLIGRKEKQSQNDESISNLNDEIKRLATEVEEKDKEIVSLQIKLELSSRKVMSVQVRHTAMFRSARVEAELQNILKTRMATEHIDLQFLDSPEFCMVQTDLPVFIVCTRLYSYKRDRNISRAITGLRDTQKKAALLMFHERDMKGFQKEVDNTEDNTEKIGGIFNIGHRTRIYEIPETSRK